MIERVGATINGELYWWDGKSEHPVVKHGSTMFLMNIRPEILEQFETEELTTLLKYKVLKWLNGEVTS